MPEGLHSLAQDLGRLAHQEPNRGKFVRGPTKAPLVEPLWPADLERARELQTLLLPRRIPDVVGFTLDGSCRVSSSVGGDFYDVLTTSSGSTLVIIADVMGGGVAAALVAATLRSLFRTLALIDSEPRRLLSQINALIQEDLETCGMFATAQLVLLDPGKQQMRVASAGHSPLLVLDPSGQVLSIAPEGLPLGIFADACYEQEQLGLASVRCGLVFTDGVIDARAPSGEYFGLERLKRWLGATIQMTRSTPGLKQNLINAIEEFQAKTRPLDDQAFVIFSSVSDRLPR